MAKNNANLHKSKKDKNDEFYTRFEDIEREMKYYKEYFNGKTVFCNCDDPIESNFTKYFILSFKHLGLKRLICTFYDIKGGNAFAFDYHGEDMNGDGIINYEDIEIIRKSKSFRQILVDDPGYNAEKKEECWAKGIYGSGDFRSGNVIFYLKQADIVVTNPPFSLFREYVPQLIQYDKKFIIIGNGNAVSYKEIFPLIKNNQIWIGASKGIGGKFTFITTDNYEGKFVEKRNGQKIAQVNNACWFTNMVHKKRNEPLTLYKKYTPEFYPKYDNFDAIESRTDKIPVDYNGVIGVPITFLDKYCPAQFEIVGLMSGAKDDVFVNGNDGRAKFYIGKKGIYVRLLIKKIS